MGDIVFQVPIALGFKAEALVKFFQVLLRADPDTGLWPALFDVIDHLPDHYLT